MKQWRVQLIDTKKSNPNHYIALGIARAIAANSRVEVIVRSDYKTAIFDLVEKKCNLIIAFDGEELDRAIMERLTSLCENKVLWVTEDPYERSINASNAELFDLVFTNDAGSVAAYGDKGRHLPFAADERLHFHDVPQFDEGHYLYDLFFAGTAWPNRARFLEQLQHAIPSVNLKLALPANPYIPAPNLGMDTSSFDWRTPNTEFAKFSNRSRSVLTLHRNFSSSGNDPVAETPGPRFFEVALAGGFQLVDTSIPEIRVNDFYVPGQDFVGFDGVKDCIDKLEHYLKYPEQRIAIARSAQKATLSKHLYFHRVETLLKQVEALSVEKQPIVLNNESSDGPRRTVLTVSHNIQGVKPYGGVEIYQELIRQALTDRIEFLFYSPDRVDGLLTSHYSLRNERLEVVESYAFPGILDETLLSCPEREEVFSSILLKYKIDLVHFQHFIGHPPSIGFLPKALGIRSVLSLHDYFSVCSRFNLLDYRGVYCDIPSLPIETCDICLNATSAMGPGSQAKRRAFFGRLLDSIDALHANTPGVAELYARIYPLLRKPGKIRVCGVPMPTAAQNEHLGGVLISSSGSSNKLRIAIPGNFAANKGGDPIVHAINQLRDDDVEFTIFGSVAPQYASIFEMLAVPNLSVYGEFSPGSLPQILKEFDLSLHFSLWPETYCISMSEAWSAGVIPIVADIGALGERVINGKNGFKLPVGEAGAIVALVRRLIKDRTELAQIKPFLKESVGVSLAEHMDWLLSLYQELMPSRPYAHGCSHQAGANLKGAGVLLVERSWAIRPENVILAGGGASPLIATAAPSRLYRLRFYLKAYGVKRTISKVIQVVRRRIGAM